MNFQKQNGTFLHFCLKTHICPAQSWRQPNLRETNFVTHNVIRWGLFVKFCRNDSHHNDPWPLVLFPKKEMDKTLHNCYLDVFFCFLWFKWQYYLVGKKMKKRVKLASSTLTTPSWVTILFLVCNSFSIYLFIYFFFFWEIITTCW